MEKPYIERVVTTTHLDYNPKYGDDRVCTCGHAYYRHFDSYEEMANIGCKYCPCGDFVEFTMETVREAIASVFNPFVFSETDALRKQMEMTMFDFVDHEFFFRTSVLRDTLKALEKTHGKIVDRIREAFKDLTMQDIRLRVGEGDLTKADFINGANAELAARFNILRPVLEMLK